MKTEYSAIPGFTHYRICKETKKVQSNSSGEWRNLSLNVSNNCYALCYKGHRYAFRFSRLMYAVENSISPLDLPEGSLVVEKCKKLCLISRSRALEYNKCNERRMDNKSEENIRDEYLKSIRFSQLVLSAYDTGDYSRVIAEMWGLEDDLRKYLRSNHIAINKKKQDELVAHIMEMTLNAITSKHACVTSVFSYMKTKARAIHSELLKEKKRLISYDERFVNDYASY